MSFATLLTLVHSHFPKVMNIVDAGLLTMMAESYGPTDPYTMLPL